MGPYMYMKEIKYLLCVCMGILFLLSMATKDTALVY